MNVSIDRIEGGIAVLTVRDDLSGRITIPLSLLPPGSREGDLLSLTLDRDPEGTAVAKERAARHIEKLKKRG
jgi:Protein of unknown function (DUF3006)